MNFSRTKAELNNKTKINLIIGEVLIKAVRSVLSDEIKEKFNTSVSLFLIDKYRNGELSNKHMIEIKKTIEKYVSQFESDAKNFPNSLDHLKINKIESEHLASYISVEASSKQELIEQIAIKNLPINYFLMQNFNDIKSAKNKKLKLFRKQILNHFKTLKDYENLITLEAFDMTSNISIARNLMSLSPVNGWTNKFDENDMTLAGCLNNIRILRNLQAHLTSNDIEINVYNDLISKSKAIIDILFKNDQILRNDYHKEIKSIIGVFENCDSHDELMNKAKEVILILVI
jgi:hypothetical protein